MKQILVILAVAALSALLTSSAAAQDSQPKEQKALVNPVRRNQVEKARKK